MESVQKIVNLTPHPMDFIFPDGSKITLPSAGVARLIEEPAIRTLINIELNGKVCAFPAVQKKLSKSVSGLPDPQPNTLYLVSLPIKSALPERNDLVVVGDQVRDPQGKPIGLASIGL